MTKQTLLILVTVLLVEVQHSLAQTQTKMMRVPIRFEHVDNLVTVGNMVRLKRVYTQDGNQPISMEAEEATEIILDHRQRRIVRDEKRSGNYYLEYAKDLVFDFHVKTPGQYQVRFLAYFPSRGNYNHNEILNDGQRVNVIDSNYQEAGVWFWTVGKTYNLEEGFNRYWLPSPTAFCGGARLDKIVMMPMDNIQPIVDMGPETSKMVTSDHGNAMTRRIKLQRIKDWQLNAAITPNDGKVTLEYSYDANGPWQPVVLNTLTTPPSPKPRYLYYRIALQAVAGKPSPWVQGLELLIHKTQITTENN